MRRRSIRFSIRFYSHSSQGLRGMDRSGEAAYIYAKASGMLAKSFVGERMSRVLEVRSLAELWSLLFKTEVPAVPEFFLAQKIEQTAEKKFLDDYIKLLRSYSHPPQVLIWLLRFYDIDNLKDIAAALCLEKQDMPYLADIGSYSFLHYNRWPDIAAITRGTPVAWYNAVPDIHSQHAMDLRLDREYTQELWRSVEALAAADRETVEPLLKEEIVINNILWALRLRIYYGMDDDAIKARLVNAAVGEVNDLASPALAVLKRPVDSFAAWEDWKYADLLNPHEEGAVWKIDPRWVELSAKVMLQKKAAAVFHKDPFSVSVLVSWFKLKQYELNCIRTVAEGLRLNVGASQMAEVTGFHTHAAIIN